MYFSGSTHLVKIVLVLVLVLVLLLLTAVEVRHGGGMERGGVCGCIVLHWLW